MHNGLFLSDEQRTLVKHIHILDETEGEYAYRPQPYTFVLRPDLSIHAIYNGWFFVGRPTLEELRYNLRSIMQTRADYNYEAYAVSYVCQDTAGEPLPDQVAAFPRATKGGVRV